MLLFLQIHLFYFENEKSLKHIDFFNKGWNMS